MLDADTASASLGIDVTAAKEGRSAARMRVTEAMVNGHGIVHGGFLFILADTAFAAACNSHGPVTVAAGAEITFVATARVGDELAATAEQRTRYGRNGIYDVTVHRLTPHGREVVAEFRGRSRTVAAPDD
ncbi:hydroxyphenylacetyl-CoA thioesterase PaaI [Streptomonospora salina]|nr:hydroxyphenylacetyl-CoA thioesterase PaaI [Streptomonospora salina]